MNNTKTGLPKESILFADRTEYNYTDSFQYTIKVSPAQMDILTIGDAFSQPGPKWFEMLFSLRNKIAKLVHLKTPDITNKKQQENYQWEIGKKAGLFTLYAKTENELILGDDDKHLNFRVSLFMQPATKESSETIVTVSTLVKLNNWLGKVYFFFVKPLHRMFVPIIMGRNFQKLESRKQK